jgi:tetratricopeptide (TPR) repeat protein
VLFEQVIASNPSAAAAHAGLAEAHALMSFPDRGRSFDVAFPIMQRSAAAALRLDPRLAEAHAATGRVYAFERKWSDAVRAFEEAIRLDPSRTLTYTSYSISTLQTLRKFDDALRLLEVAAQHDPQSLDVQREIGEVLLYAGRFDEAVDVFQRVRTADPDLTFVQTYLARALIFAGRVDEALPLWQPSAIWPAQAYVRIGRRSDAEALAVEHGAHPHRMALIAAALGDTARAIEALERAASSAPHRIGRLLNEPELAALRDHERVVALRQAFGVP